jgi:hypothetical protein
MGNLRHVLFRIRLARLDLDSDFLTGTCRHEVDRAVSFDRVFTPDLAALSLKMLRRLVYPEHMLQALRWFRTGVDAERGTEAPALVSHLEQYHLAGPHGGRDAFNDTSRCKRFTDSIAAPTGQVEALISRDCR